MEPSIILLFASSGSGLPVHKPALATDFVLINLSNENESDEGGLDNDDELDDMGKKRISITFKNIKSITKMLLILHF